MSPQSLKLYFLMAIQTDVREKYPIIMKMYPGPLDAEDYLWLGYHKLFYLMQMIYFGKTDFFFLSYTGSSNKKMLKQIVSFYIHD